MKRSLNIRSRCAAPSRINRRRGPDPGRGRFSVFLGLSAMVHLAVAVCVLRLFWSTPDPGATLAEVQDVDVVSLRENKKEPNEPVRLEEPVPDDEWVDEPALSQARQGDPLASAGRMAADTLHEDPDRGARAGRDEPSPSPDPMAGQELHDLRTRMFNHPRRDSLQRIRTASRSVTYDNDRATPNPQPTPFLATGRGSRTSRARAPDRAVRSFTGQASRRMVRSGAAAQSQESGELDPVEEPGMEHLASRYLPLAGSPATYRPLLEQRPPRTISARQRMDLADRRDSELASTRLQPDMMDTARPTGRGIFTGLGQGSLAGRRGDPIGDREGPQIWLSNPDRRYIGYFTNIYKRIHPLWTFPRDLQILLEQGDVIVRFTIQADGRISDVRIQKSSGFPRFDRIVVAAIRKAAPFGPIPQGLGSRIHVVAPFEFRNPLVR